MKSEVPSPSSVVPTLPTNSGVDDAMPDVIMEEYSPEYRSFTRPLLSEDETSSNETKILMSLVSSNLVVNSLRHNYFFSRIFLEDLIIKSGPSNLRVWYIMKAIKNMSYSPFHKIMQDNV